MNGILGIFWLIQEDSTRVILLISKNQGMELKYLQMEMFMKDCLNKTYPMVKESTVGKTKLPIKVILHMDYETGKESWRQLITLSIKDHLLMKNLKGIA